MLRSTANQKNPGMCPVVMIVSKVSVLKRRHTMAHSSSYTRL
jgi:hypothetical protein